MVRLVRLVRLCISTHTIDPHVTLMLTTHGTSGGTTRVGWRERKGPGTTQGGRYSYENRNNPVVTEEPEAAEVNLA